MEIRDAFLPEFDHEMGTTRKTLERVPETNTNWKPHDKSMTIGRLAGHLAELPSLVPVALAQDSIDFRPPGAPPRQPNIMTDCKKLLEDFDKNVAAALDAIAKSSDEDLKKIFTRQAGGRTIFSLPRAAALRSFVMNHIIHHRGQLSVYLRLNNVAVPSIYGPSADEQN